MIGPIGKEFIIEKERSRTTGMRKRSKDCFDYRYSIFLSLFSSKNREKKEKRELTVEEKEYLASK